MSGASPLFSNQCNVHKQILDPLVCGRATPATPRCANDPQGLQLYVLGVILASSLNSYYSSRYAMMELLPIHSILPSSKGLMWGSQNVLGQQNSVYKQSLFPGGLFIDASP
jgi:hypothetical protein